MASLRLLFSYASGGFAKFAADAEKPLAAAGTGAIKAAGDKLKQEARADIAAAGFSTKWQNAFRVNTYPAKPSLDAAAFGFHKIAYADIFETGGAIAGKPLLWLPLKNAPLRIGGKKITPALYQAEIGPLRFVPRPGKPPLLFAQQAATRSKKSRLSLSSLRRGAAGIGDTRSVPLFVGIDTVKIGKKFHIAQVAAKVQALLPDLFAENFKGE